MRSILFVAMVSVLVLAGCSKETAGYQHIADDDKAMEAAVAKAIATTNDFVVAYRAKKPETKNFFLKKPYPTPNGSQEHMWIEITGEGDGVFSGVVSNDAEETKAVKMGQKVFVKLDEISDWKYEEGKKLIGGYTIRYFVDKMSAAERKAFLQQAGFEL
jgi:uncharacterized protein YegJ (DUF2314 family)